jgi:hypothetical protein
MVFKEPGISLQSLVSHSGQEGLRPLIVFRVARLAALLECDTHHLGVTHGGLKAANILLRKKRDLSGGLYVSDFAHAIIDPDELNLVGALTDIRSVYLLICELNTLLPELINAVIDEGHPYLPLRDYMKEIYRLTMTPRKLSQIDYYQSDVTLGVAARAVAFL